MGRRRRAGRQVDALHHPRPGGDVNRYDTFREPHQALPMPVGAGLCAFELELAFVESAAGNRADDAFGHTACCTPPGCPRRCCSTAGSDDRRLGRLREAQRGFDMKPLSCRRGRCRVDHARCRIPRNFFARSTTSWPVTWTSLRRHLAVLASASGDDVPRERVAGIGEKTRILHRRGADHDIGDAGVEVASRSCRR